MDRQQLAAEFVTCTEVHSRRKFVEAHHDDIAAILTEWVQQAQEIANLESVLASLADLINQELRENYGQFDQVQQGYKGLGVLATAVRRLVDLVRARQAQAIARLTERLERQQPYVAFWAKVRENIFEGISGADVQEWAVEVGLLVEVIYDPAIHGDVAEADPGQTIYVDAPWLAAALAEEKRP